MPTLNTHLLDEIYAMLVLNTHLHDQEQWWAHGVLTRESVGEIRAQLNQGTDCGTTACVAGWAAILTAPRDAVIDKEYIQISNHWLEISEYAQEQMGLTDEQADWLFWGTTNEAALWCLKWLKDHQDAGIDYLADAWHAHWYGRHEHRTA